MLGIILIIIIGKQFFNLSKEYNQNKWLFAILGIVSYYAGVFIGGGILGALDVFLDLRIDWDNNLMMSFLAIPFGIGSVCLFYYLLKKNWSKNIVPESTNEIQDIGKNIEDLEENN